MWINNTLIRPVIWTIVFSIPVMGISIRIAAQSDDPRPYDEWRLVSVERMDTTIGNRIVDTYPEWNRAIDEDRPDVFIPLPQMAAS